MPGNVQKGCVTRKKASFDSVPQWGAEFAPARRWLPAAGGDRAWAVRTGSGPPNQGDPPDEGRRSTQVAGSTKVVVCEGVVITSIQPTPKSFRVNTDDDAALQARSNTWRTAQLKIAVRLHQQVRRRDAHIRRRVCSA